MIKSKILKFLLIGIILVMGSSSSVSGFTNSNSDKNLSSFNDSSDIAQNTIGDVLVLYEDALANAEYAVSGVSNYTLTFWALGSSNTPNLTDLTPYSAIIVTSNYAYSDSIGVGNVLADYVDAGGKVIQLSHSFSSGFSILGRFNSSGYMPFWGTIGSVSRTYDGLSTHPIFADVTSFIPTHSFNAVPTSGSQVIASYSDGEPLMAIKGSVIAMNAYVGLTVVGDLGVILDNAITFILAPSVLVLYEDALANAQFAVSGIIMYRIDFWALGSSNTPKLTDLTPYPVIIVTSNYAYSDSIGVGNVLADFVDAGGKVIQLSHSFSSGFSILGRFNSSGYMPFWGTIGSVSRNYDNLSAHPIFADVTSFNPKHSFNAVPTSGSKVIASYSDGEPLMAIKGSVIAMNAYVGFSVVGDLGLILENSIEFLILSVVPNLVPTFTSSPDATVEFRNTGDSIQWTLYDDNPDNYTVIHLNTGDALQTGFWSDGDIISVSLENYELGTHQFRIIVWDLSGNVINHKITVLVEDTIIPLVNEPVDIEYELGDSGNQIIWLVEDHDPANYAVLINGASFAYQEGIWSNDESILVDVNDLDVGVYTFDLVVYDGSGNQGGDRVLVEVIDVITLPSTTSVPPTTSEPPATTTEDTISTSESEDTTPELPIPFSNIYLIIFSILGLTMISRIKKN